MAGTCILELVCPTSGCRGCGKYAKDYTTQQTAQRLSGKGGFRQIHRGDLERDINVLKKLKFSFWFLQNSEISILWLQEQCCRLTEIFSFRLTGRKTKFPVFRFGSGLCGTFKSGPESGTRNSGKISPVRNAESGTRNPELSKTIKIMRKLDQISIFSSLW